MGGIWRSWGGSWGAVRVRVRGPTYDPGGYDEECLALKYKQVKGAAARHIRMCLLSM